MIAAAIEKVFPAPTVAVTQSRGANPRVYVSGNMQHVIAFEASEIGSSAVAGIIDALLKGCAPSKSTGSARPLQVRSKLLSIPALDRLPGRREEGAETTSGSTTGFVSWFKPRCDVDGVG